MKGAKTAARNGRRRRSEKELEELKARVVANLPFMKRVFEISDRVPLRDWKKLPPDLAVNLDHYLYGLPKRKR